MRVSIDCVRYIDFELWHWNQQVHLTHATQPSCSQDHSHSKAGQDALRHECLELEC